MNFIFKKINVSLNTISRSWKIIYMGYKEENYSEAPERNETSKFWWVETCGRAKEGSKTMP